MRTKLTIVLALLALSLAFARPLSAQDELRSQQWIETRLAQLSEADTPENAAAIEELTKALNFLKAERLEQAESERLSSEIAETATLLPDLRAELANSAPAEPPVPTDLGSRELEQRLADAQSNRETVRQDVAELERLSADRETRKSALPDEIARARQAIVQLEEALRTLPEDTTEARRVARASELALRRAELRHREKERELIEVRREVLPLRRERAQRRAAVAENAVNRLQELVAGARTREAEAAVAEAARQRRETTNRFPSLAELATETERVAKQNTDLPNRIEKIQRDTAERRSRLAEVRRRYASTLRRVTVGGLTEGMGVVLRRDYDWLLDAQVLRAEEAQHQNELSETLLRQFEYEERLGDLHPLSQAHERLVERLELGESDQLTVELARTLLETQEAAYDRAIDGLDEIAELLLAWQRVHDDLTLVSGEYRDYIAERILWVRSTGSNPLPSLYAIPRHAIELVSEGDWARSFPELLAGLRQNAGRSFAFILVIGTLLVLRRKLRELRAELGELVRFHRTDRFVYTLRVTLQNVLLALPLPLTLWGIGMALSDAPTALVRAMGDGCTGIAPIALLLDVTFRIAKEKSLGEAHFRWSPRAMSQLRFELWWFLPTILILAFLAFTFDNVQRPAWSDSLGRSAFVLAMLSLSIFSYRLQREDGAFGPRKVKNKQSLFGRTHRLWALLATGLPLALAGLALAGYTYTASQFELRVRASIALTAILAYVHALLFRWLYMTRRRLAVEQARQRAKARLEAAGGETPAATIDEDKLNIPAIDQQTQKLFRSMIAVTAFFGLFFLWANVLPALRALERVQLYPTLEILSDREDSPTTTVDLGALEASPEATEPAPGMPASPAMAILDSPSSSGSDQAAASESDSGPIVSVLTLADLLMSIFLLVLTGIASKNLPGLLEISLLQRLPLDSGSRFALSTLLRYVILIVGVTLAAGAVGLGWNKVQWLAAALTFGLAFGLQEIFANFVSGLIILIERPVRVGDFVTVGGTEGRVTRLRMRATTILDYDRREILIPNKEFITSSVTNWTLSDPVTRIVLIVGVAYGSDIPLAHETLRAAAKSEPMVLADPGPQIVFRKFGDSTLDFEVRIFIASRETWAEVTDKVNSRIDAACRAASIEIAFPQRDLHIRTAPALETMLAGRTSARAEDASDS